MKNLNNEILELTEEFVPRCADIYINVFTSPPWNEQLEYKNVRRFIDNWIKLNNFIGMVIKNENSEICGFCLGVIKPSVGMNAFYLEELCIDNVYQKKGFGGDLLNEVENTLIKANVRKIILNTNSMYYSKKFYEDRHYSCIPNFVTMGKKL